MAAAEWNMLGLFWMKLTSSSASATSPAVVLAAMPMGYPF